ncbi:TPA: recombination protein RecR [Candidatus Berkelbacteria bacterium]|uniref:Recombination protein RecR n=1 Tax=Berkelbacteria bacterium GW2011_GWE1_39_12 TaxID=1618337 RepID=A0A0G4B378_9BACT|nr:MAG: recombination protein RecR, recombination protein RecR [Berkelbacteria bacterium GW2011_GWE1_39_12]HBO60445.1 recombination protein RecR [Candidatus Berkelbacteria bacterium]
MSKILPDSVQKLIDEFGKLPGIGPKTASRLVFYLLTKSNTDIESLGESVTNLKKNLVYCQECFNIAEQSPCNICADPKREKNTVMVVEEPLDVVALSKTSYNGLYHVLGGVISPIDGVGPEQLRVAELIAKLKEEKFDEMILATDPSLEGEATAMYIAKLVEKDKIKIKVTRIARGLPVGGDLEYADEITLTRALEGRNAY